MLETKCAGDNLKMLVTLASSSNIQNGSYYRVETFFDEEDTITRTSSKRCHQDLNSVANILKLSPTVSHQHQNITNMPVAKLKAIKVTFCQKAEEYYRDINDYKGDWPGIKFSSSLQCKFPCNLNVHALFLLSYCPLSYQYAYISSKSGILKIAVFE